MGRGRLGRARGGDPDARADRRGCEREPHGSDRGHLGPGRGRRLRPGRDRDEGDERRGRGGSREAAARAGHRRAADPERPRQRRPGRRGPRRGARRDRRRRRVRRLDGRAGARAPQRLGARAARRARRVGDPADPSGSRRRGRRRAFASRSTTTSTSSSGRSSICNVCFSGTCAILERPIRGVLDDAAAWHVASSCAQEAYDVARARGITLELRRSRRVRPRLRREDPGRAAVDAARRARRASVRDRRDQRRHPAGRAGGRARRRR